MSRFPIRLIAAVAVLFIALEASGVASAFDAGPVVECCCGSHGIENPCGCPDCPGGRAQLGLSAVSAETPAEDGMARFQPCHRHLQERVLTVTPSLPPPSPLRLLPPGTTAEWLEPLVARLQDRLPDASRPPP
ncbi:MAG TPA: hypothetical protein VH877_06500 [Polyangia bacterium]|nr:hypothetical protein [Polyangia bacterium]